MNGAWQYNDTSYTYTPPPPVKAVVISPVNGSTNSGSTVTYTWNAGVGASQYQLYVGSAVGGSDLYLVGASTNLSCTASEPMDGRPIYTTLWQLINGAWQSTSNNYTAYTAVKARMSGLALGSTLSSGTVTFNWDGGAGVSDYMLYVGSSARGTDLGYQAGSTNRSATITLPTDGRQVYVTLYSLINGVWKANDYVYGANTATEPVPAQMLSPANGSTLTNATTTFTWNSGTNVSQYLLYAGSVPLGADLGSQAASTNLSATITLPADGGPVYVTLYSLINGAWQPNSYNYVAAGSSGKSVMISPANGTTFTTASTNFIWSAGTGVSLYQPYFGSTPGGSDLGLQGANTNLSQTVTLPVDGRKVYVTLYSLLGGVWVRNSYVYVASSAGGPAPAQMLSPVGGTTLTGAVVNFNWSTGVSVSQYQLYVGTWPLGSDLGVYSTGTNRSVNVIVPTDGEPIYATLYSLVAGAWQEMSYIYLTTGP